MKNVKFGKDGIQNAQLFDKHYEEFRAAVKNGEETVGNGEKTQ